ncbi:hypothetical protein KKF59_00090, partial [Patescibacteria group bacterium]|nr:hypothetical protein [Patescibacteria group bacterium]
MKELFKSAALRYALIVLGSLMLLLGSFRAGILVGERKSRHFANWPHQYGQMFNQRERSRIPMPPPMLPGTHGVFGKVISIEAPVMVVQGKDNIEQTVRMTTSTEIRAGRDRAAAEDIKADMDVSVFGEP